MQRTDLANNDLQRSEYEAACRDFWSAFVMVETGRRPDGPSKSWIKVKNPNACPPQPGSRGYVLSGLTNRK
jgi:hypothetical protein